MLTTIFFQVRRGDDITPEADVAEAVATENRGGAKRFSFRIKADDEDARTRAEDVLCSRLDEDIPAHVMIGRKHSQSIGYQQPRTVDVYEGRVSFNDDAPACDGSNLMFTLMDVRHTTIWQ